MFDAAAIELPVWARVGDDRRAHIARVTALLDAWSAELRLGDAERQAWHDAGRWHDALRDATPAELRALVPELDLPEDLLHGPAAAARLELDGESRHEVLDAVRWHTVGNARWSRVGRALYMADFLEPGRPFGRGDRAFLAAQAARDFEGVFRQVVRRRLVWSLGEGNRLLPETVEMWNAAQ